MKESSQSSSRSGFTLTEILIVVTIIAIVVLAVLLLGWKRQAARGRDARRKSDLYLMQKALEEYYNDRDCYPLEINLATCGGNELAPYLGKTPCEPVGGLAYKFIQRSATDACAGYYLCTKLEDLADLAITGVGCDPVDGCGFGPEYNYCVAMGGAATSPGFLPGAGSTPTPTPEPPLPTPTPIGQLFACQPWWMGCNSYAAPLENGCPVYWSGGCPPGACLIPGNWCTN